MGTLAFVVVSLVCLNGCSASISEGARSASPSSAHAPLATSAVVTPVSVESTTPQIPSPPSLMSCATRAPADVAEKFIRAISVQYRNLSLLCLFEAKLNGLDASSRAGQAIARDRNWVLLTGLPK